MQIIFKILTVVLLGVGLTLSWGCNRNVPVTPNLEAEGPAKGSAPPPGQEPVLKEEGP